MATTHFLLYKLLGIPFTLSPDHVEFSYPPLAAMKMAMEEGRWPLWHSQVFTGNPLLFMGSMDIKILPLLRCVSVLDSMLFLTSLYIFFGSISFGAMARKLFNFSWGPIFAVTPFWILNGYYSWYFYDTPYGPFFAWLPLQILALLHFEKHPYFYFSILVATLFDQFLMGREDCLEINLIGAGIFCLIYWITRRDASTRGKCKYCWENSYRTAGRLLAAGILAVLLCAPLMAEHIDQIRSSLRFANKVEGMTYPLAWVNFFGTIPNATDFFGLSDGVGHRTYVGFFNLSLVLLATKLALEKKRTALFFSAAVFIVVLMTDLKIGGVGLFELYRMLPGHAGNRYSIRFAPLFFLFTSILLLEGWKVLLEKEKQRGRLRIIAAAIALFLCFPTVFLLQRFYKHITSGGHGALLVALFVGNIIGFTLLAFFRWRSSGRILLIYGCVLQITSAYLTNYMMGDQGRGLRFFKKLHNEGERGDVLKFFLSRPVHSYRVFSAGAEHDSWNEYLASYGVHVASGYYQLVKSDLAIFFHKVLDAHFYNKLRPRDVVLAPYNIMNIRYWILSGNELKLLSDETPGVKKILASADGKTVIYESTGAFDRVYLRNQWEVLNESEIAPRIRERVVQNPDWFKRGVFVSGTSIPKISVEKNRPLGSARIVSYHNDEVRIDVDTESGGILVFTDYFDKKRWKAEVDGNEALIFHANMAFRGVALSPGKHLVKFYYVVPKIPFLVAGITFILLALYLIPRLRKELSS